MLVGVVSAIVFVVVFVGLIAVVFALCVRRQVRLPPRGARHGKQAQPIMFEVPAPGLQVQPSARC